MLLHESYRHDKLLYNVFNSIFLFCLSLGLVGIYLFYRADVMRVRVTSNEATGWIKTEMQEVNRSLFFCNHPLLVAEGCACFLFLPQFAAEAFCIVESYSKVYI